MNDIWITLCRIGKVVSIVLIIICFVIGEELMAVYFLGCMIVFGVEEIRLEVLAKKE